MSKGFSAADLLAMGLVETSSGIYVKQKQLPKPKGKKNREQNQQETYILNKDIQPNDIVLQWSDKHISLNQWYSSEHWTKRNKAKEDWHNFFTNLLPKPLIRINTYSITLEYNSRLDPSNTITMVKLLEDTMQKIGIINNDNKNYCKGIHLSPNLLMKSNSYRIIIKSL